MSTQTLSRVTLETLANVRTAATQVMTAYGAGSRRLVQAVDGTLARQVLPVTSRLVPAAGKRLDAWRGRLSRTVEQGIDTAVARSERAIGVGSDFAVAQIERWTDRLVDIDNAMIAQGLDTAARLSLPAAQLARAVTGKVAEGTATLGGAVAAEAGAVPARKARKAPVARKAAPRRADKAPVKAARKARGSAAAAPKALRARRVATA